MQTVELRRPARSDIETFLQERGVDRDTAGVIARECDGDVGRALALSMGQDDDSPYGELFVRFVRSAFMAKKNAGELNNLMAWADDVARLPRESQKQFIQYVYGVFRAALMSSYGLEAMGRVGGLPQGFNFASFCNYVHSRNIRAIYDLLSDAAFHIERNASPRLTFMDMAVKITRLLHTKAV
jgi:DNA polymerase-3 subunit delta'